MQSTAASLHCAIVYFTHKSPLPRLPLADIEPSGWLSLRINIEEAGRQAARGRGGEWAQNGIKDNRLSSFDSFYIFSASPRISPFGTISKVFSFPFSAMSRWADNLTDLEKGREGEEFKGKEEGEGERSE